MKAVEILNHHHLKRTSCREGILDVLISAIGPLSENEICQSLPGNYDRSTFYRSFIKLVDCKILHKIVVDNQVVKYAISNAITHQDEHAHFYCHECHTLKCLHEVPLSLTPLPEGFIAEEKEVIIKGICSDCNQ